MLKRKNLHQVMMTLIFTLTATMMFGQSFYKTYTQRVPAYPYDIFANGSGYKIYASDNSFPSSERNYYQINTDANGNSTANQAHNLGSFSNRAVTYRTRSGYYIFMDKNEAAGQMTVRTIRPNGTTQSNAVLSFPAGHLAKATAATQYPNGNILVTYYHGAPWTDPFDIPQRTIRWAQVNPNNGAIISQGSMLSRRVDSFQAEVEVNAVAVSPNGSIFIANVEDTPISERHYLTKINPNGTEAWFYQTATLERGIFRLEATSDNQAIYNHTQSLEGVFKVNGPSDFTFSKNIEGVFRRALNRELIVPTNDGGAFIIVDGDEPGSGFFRPNTLHVARLDRNGNVVAQNVITQAGNTTHKRPTAAIINSAGELIVTGWDDPTPNGPVSDGRPFLLKLGSNGQWVNGGGGNGADLEMTGATSNPNPNIWQATDLTFTLKNTGSQSATNVRVKVDIPGTIILQGGNEYQASQGSFSPYGNRIWNVGTVAAGSTKTLKLNFYNPNTNAKNVFAQVQSANGNDPDSTPGNGTCCNGLEDDETFVAFNGGTIPTRFPDLRGSDLRAASTSAKAGSVLNYTFDLSNVGDVAVSGDYVIKARLSRSNTNAFFGEEVGVVNTGNTPLGTIQNVPGAITIPANLAPRTYYLWLLIDEPNRVRELNEQNNRVLYNTPITVTAPNGGGGGAIDISMSASPSNPNQWAFFSATITARNTGSSRANNVKVKLNTPSAITYRGGMEFTSSKGSLDWWNSETWNIGSLNAGQTATLTVNFFRLSANGFTVRANVTSGGGNDSASVNFGSAANGVNNRSAVINNMQNEPFAIVNAYPNPSTEHITVAVYSNEAQTSDLEIFSLTGKRVFGNSYDLQEGLNEIKIETARFQSGQYFIKMNPFHPYLRKIDFTKVK